MPHAAMAVAPIPGLHGSWPLRRKILPENRARTCCTSRLKPRRSVSQIFVSGSARVLSFRAQSVLRDHLGERAWDREAVADLRTTDLLAVPTCGRSTTEDIARWSGRARLGDRLAGSLAGLLEGRPRRGPRGRATQAFSAVARPADTGNRATRVDGRMPLGSRPAKLFCSPNVARKKRGRFSGRSAFSVSA